LSKGRYTFGASRPNALIAEPPLRVNAAMEAVPWLLTDWRHLGNGVHHVRLRPGVCFHDGSPLTAKTFAESAREFIAPRDFIGLNAPSIKAIGDDTVELQSTCGSGWMVDTMTHAAASVFRVHPRWQSRPLGTGPFRLVSYTPQERLDLTRFEDYWGTRPEQLRVQYRFLPDPQSRLQALQRGDVHVISEVVPEMLAALDPDDVRVRMHVSRPVRFAALLCNTKGPEPYRLLRDIRVRRALALAINREAVQRILYSGQAEVAKSILPAWMYGLGDASCTGFGFDRRAAESLLEEAGWQRGEDGIRQKGDRQLRLRLVAAFPSASLVKPLPEVLEQMFRAIGVATEIAQVEDGELYYTAYADRGEGDLFLEVAGGGNSDPTYLLSNLFHSQSPWPLYRYIAPGERVDSLIDEARNEPNRKRVVDLVREAQRRIVDDSIAAIPILMVPNFVLSARTVALTMSENLDWINFGSARFA
jgi:peptide/nickel transport system substrate-binding protein